MNPLDKSWDFLKAPMEGGENKKRLLEQAEARRRTLRARQNMREAEENQAKLNLGPPKTTKTPMDRVSTTPSTGSVEKPTEGTGFENLTEEQIQDLKYRRGGA